MITSARNLTPLFIAGLLAAAPLSAAENTGWAGSPANAWLVEKPIPEKYRNQIKTTAPDSADAHQPGTFLAVNTPAGMARLKRSRYKEDYWTLSVNFATQIRQTLCSVATAVTVLNSLPIKRPLDQVYKPYPYFTQANYFNDDVAKLRSYQHTLTDGMTLQMAAQAMRVHGAVTKPVHASDISVDAMREMIKGNLAKNGDFVAINYQRKFIGQPKGAHFSPIGAYDAKTDTFLILDVARYKFPPVWVRADDLHKAMNTFDSEVPKTRGFILVSAS